VHHQFADVNQIVQDLDWFRVALVTTLTTGGGYGMFRLFKLFNTDFLTPYRTELGELRDETADAKKEAKKAREESGLLRVELYQCQEREQKLRLDLIRAGINIPPPDPHGAP
jgi:hypothetical protein